MTNGYYSRNGDGYGPGVNDYTMRVALECEDCGFQDTVEVEVTDGGDMVGECPVCATMFYPLYQDGF